MPNDVIQINYSHESNMQNDQSETDTLTIYHVIKKSLFSLHVIAENLLKRIRDYL